MMISRLLREKTHLQSAGKTAALSAKGCWSDLYNSVSNVPSHDLHMFYSHLQWMASKREALSCRPALGGEFRGGASVANGETRAFVSVLKCMLRLAIAGLQAFC